MKKPETFECPCFSEEMLDNVISLSWSDGWWSDVPGCKEAPYEDLREIWMVNAGGKGEKLDLHFQAGILHGQPFVSAAIYNHRSRAYDLLCGGTMSAQEARPCIELLERSISKISTTNHDRNYCLQFPQS